MQQGSLSQDSSILSGKCFASIGSYPFIISTVANADASAGLQTVGAGKAMREDNSISLPALGADTQEVKDRMQQLELNER